MQTMQIHSSESNCWDTNLRGLQPCAQGPVNGSRVASAPRNAAAAAAAAKQWDVCVSE